MNRDDINKLLKELCKKRELLIQAVETRENKIFSDEEKKQITEWDAAEERAKKELEALDAAEEIAAIKKRNLETEEILSDIRVRSPANDGDTAPTKTLQRDTPLQASETREQIEAFAHYIRSGNDTELRAIAPNSQGGDVLMPVAIHTPMLEAINKQSILAQICNLIPNASNNMRVPVEEETPTAAKRAYGARAASIDSDLATGTAMTAQPISQAILIDNDMKNDSAINLVTLITKVLARSLAQGEEKYCLKKLYDAVTLTHTTAGADVTLPDVESFFFMLRSGGETNTSFVLAPEVRQAAYTLKDNNGRPLYYLSLADGGGTQLFGRPTFSSEFFEVKDKGKVCALLGNFSDVYLARFNSGITILTEVIASTNQTRIVAHMRTDIAIARKNALAKLVYKA